MDLFFNRRWFYKQELRMGKNVLHIKKSGLFGSKEYEIPFDSIGFAKSVEVSFKDSAFITSLISLIFSVLFGLGDSWSLFVAFGYISLITFSFALFTRKRTVTIPVYGEENIVLFFNKSNKAEVLEYADHLIQIVKNYLKAKYSKFDRLMPQERQFEHLYYLKDRDLISDEEYERIKEYLLGKGNETIGFGR